MKAFILLVTFSICFTACKDKEMPEFDRSEMLENMATNVIKPEISTFNTELINLKASADLFNTNPSVGNLNEFRLNFLAGYVQFQHVKVYDFGPAADKRIKATMNTYPTDTDKIISNIESGVYNLGSLDNTSAIGFPAIEYLLFAGSDSEVIDRLTTASTADNTRAYLSDLTTKMSADYAEVLAAWNGTYKNTFVAANGTDVGSSISLFFNELVKDIELIKNAKIGIPSGQLSGGETFPDFVESFYAGQSRTLAAENMTALKNLFTGGSGMGLDDYIDFAAENEGVNVTSAEIKTQFDDCINGINALGAEFSSDIPTNSAGFSTTFLAIKKLVAYCKTDIPAAIGVLISFSDTDGD